MTDRLSTITCQTHCIATAQTAQDSLSCIMPGMNLPVCSQLLSGEEVRRTGLLDV